MGAGFVAEGFQCWAEAEAFRFARVQELCLQGQPILLEPMPIQHMEKILRVDYFIRVLGLLLLLLLFGKAC